MRTKTTLAVRLVTRVTRVTRVDSPKTLAESGSGHMRVKSNRPYLESAIFETCLISTCIVLSFESI